MKKASTRRFPGTASLTAVMLRISVLVPRETLIWIHLAEPPGNIKKAGSPPAWVVQISTSLFLTAYRAARVRSDTPSLPKTEVRWFFTVRSLMNN